MKKLQTEDIERIYVCKKNQNYPNFIEKVLIQYWGGSKEYFEFPYSYEEMNLADKKLYTDLVHYIEDNLSKRNYSSGGHLGKRTVIMVPDKAEELKEYVDYQINLIKQEKCIKIEKRMDIAKIDIEKSHIRLGLTESFIAAFSSPWFLVLNTILSSKNFIKAIRNNNRRKDLGVENKHLKKLKLYFSYLMLSLNIGLNVKNLSVNFDKMSHDITLIKVMAQQVSVVSNLDNPFSDSDSELLVTTSDASTNLLMEAFELNPFLDEKDLEIALSMENYIKSNPYFNYEKLYKTFASFGIIHTNYDNNQIAAQNRQNLGIDIISIYNYDNAKQDSYYITSLEHEIIHFTGHLDNFILNEGMTTLLQAEYFENGVVYSYHDPLLLTKIFCELIGSDKMLEAYSKEDMSIIKEEMLKINSSEDNLMILLSSLQKYGSEYVEATENDSLSIPSANTMVFLVSFSPYIDSENLSESAKMNIYKYIDNLGTNKNVILKFYFNKDQGNEMTSSLKNDFLENRESRK